LEIINKEDVMNAGTFRRAALTLMLASLPCFVTAAGSPSDDSAQAAAADQIALYDGATYYAPGSYSSWFYVAPPAYDGNSPAPDAATPKAGRTALNLPAYYDYEPRWGPLYG
jgi:hypothetical protein